MLSLRNSWQTYPSKVGWIKVDQGASGKNTTDKHRAQGNFFPTLLGQNSYLLNQLLDFDQTCIDTLLGEGKELTRFCRDYFQGRCEWFAHFSVKNLIEIGLMGEKSRSKT